MARDNLQDVTGVECGLCHREVFRLVPRTVTHKVDVCPGCAQRIDVEQMEKEAQASVDGMTKPERRRFFQEQSFKWAEKLHGKKVIIRWHQRDGYGSDSKHESQIRGTAYRTGDECGGWGNVKVVIDPAEHWRISLEWTYSIEYGTGKHCPYQKPIIEGQKYGLYLNLNGDGSYYTLVSWGNRKCLALALAEKVGK